MKQRLAVMLRRLDQGGRYAAALTLLPQAHRVGFYDPDAEASVMAEWDRVRAVVGDLMQPTDYWPPRFRVREFPTAEQLQAMGAGPMGA
jgi:hypothetical protein